MRKGFTLIELLVVITLIAVIVALLIPATCNVRRAAIRMACQSNLRYIGVGTHGFNDTNKHFPTGTVPGTLWPPDQRLSLHAVLLPYLEEDATYKKLNPTQVWDTAANRAAVTGTYIRVFVCQEWMNERGAAAGVFGASGHTAVTNYVGVAGVGLDAATRPANAPGNGVFGYDRVLKADDVKDGLSETMMMTETGHGISPWLRGGQGTVRPIDTTAGQLTGDGLPFGGTHFLDANLLEPKRAQGFHLLLADGSVRYTVNTVHPDLLAALATVAGGESLPAGW